MAFCVLILELNVFDYSCLNPNILLSRLYVTRLFLFLYSTCPCDMVQPIPCDHRTNANRPSEHTLNSRSCKCAPLLTSQCTRPSWYIYRLLGNTCQWSQHILFAWFLKRKIHNDAGTRINTNGAVHLQCLMGMGSSAALC